MHKFASLCHLRAFIAAAELGSVGKASTALCRAPSAITRSLRLLEDIFSVDLFERTADGLLCSASGNALLIRSRRIMCEFELGVAEARACGHCAALAARLPLPATLFQERRLLSFVMLAESGHLPTVAQALGISQPAISGAIGAIEAGLGVALFEHTPQGMRKTAAGEYLVLRAKRALAELRHIEDDLAALKGRTEGRVVVGALPLGRTAILPRAIAAVLRQHPQLRFATVEGPFDTLAYALRAGDIDFMLGALRPAGYAADLVGEALLTDCVSVIARAHHPLAARTGLRACDLMQSQWILSNPGTPARMLFDLSFCAAQLAPPREAVETSDLAVLRGLLLHSDMITAISARQLQYEISAGILTVLDIQLPHTCRVIGITQRAESRPSPGALVLMEAIRAMASST
jgi:LysR family transcriptional regulator of gallate degradation